MVKDTDFGLRRHPPPRMLRAPHPTVNEKPPGLARDLADSASELAAFLDSDPELTGEVLRQLGRTLNDCDRALAGLDEQIAEEAPAGSLVVQRYLDLTVMHRSRTGWAYCWVAGDWGCWSLMGTPPSVSGWCALSPPRGGPVRGAYPSDKAAPPPWPALYDLLRRPAPDRVSGRARERGQEITTCTGGRPVVDSPSSPVS